MNEYGSNNPLSADGAQYRLLTVDEVAVILRRTPTSVRHLIASKQLTSGRVGGRRMIRESDLNAFISAGFEDHAEGDTRTEKREAKRRAELRGRLAAEDRRTRMAHDAETRP